MLLNLISGTNCDDLLLTVGDILGALARFDVAVTALKDDVLVRSAGGFGTFSVCASCCCKRSSDVQSCTNIKLPHSEATCIRGL